MYHQSSFSQLTPLKQIHFSTDIDTMIFDDLSIVYSNDNSIIEFHVNDGSINSSSDFNLSNYADIDGYHHEDELCGDSIYSLDSAAEIAGQVIFPADVFTLSGNKILDSRAENIPSSININAISRDPINCDLIFSLNSSSMLNGLYFTKNDLIKYHEISGFSFYQEFGFDINIDALHVISETRFLISTDVGYSYNDSDSYDEDVIEINMAPDQESHSIAFEPGLINTSLAGADLNALWVNPLLAGNVNWQDAHLDVQENQQILTINIEMLNGTDGDITLAISSEDGTAIAGIDYQFIDSDFIMLDGENSIFIELELIVDNIEEQNEDLILTINSVTNGAKIGNQSHVTIKILDDDFVIFENGFE